MTIPNYVEVQPAYGRTYTRQADVKADWNADLDFRVIGGPWVNKSDAKSHGIHVIARYGKNLEKVVALS